MATRVEGAPDEERTGEPDLLGYLTQLLSQLRPRHPTQGDQNAQDG
jgi:hypothetical protein